MTTTAVRPGAPAATSARSPLVGGRARAISYNRISSFRVNRGGVEAEISRGVDRQEADAVSAARDLDLGPVLHYTDNGESASAYATKERTDWPEFLAAIRSGDYTHALLWNVDRAARTTEAFDEFLAACRAGGVLIVQTATMQVADPFNIHDVHNLKQAALQAEYEVAKMSMRQRRAKAEALAMGKVHGGRRRFGYEDGMAAIRESEATIVVDLVDRFLAGESLRSLAAWLNRTGVPTPSTEYRVAAGKAPAKWTGPNLRGLLGGPHLAGLRVHGRDTKGRPVVVGKGKWAPIIPEETHHQVVSKLRDPSRRPSGSGNARVWLLSGLATCAECETPLRARPGYTTRKGHTVPPSYYCPTGRHVHRRADMVDAVTERAVVGILSRYSGTLFTDHAASAEVVRLRGLRQALADRMADYGAEAASMPPAAFTAAWNGLQAEADALEAQLVAASAMVQQGSRILHGATGPEAEAAWFGTEGNPGWDLSRKRALIAEVATVTVHGGKGNNTAKGARFNPEDVVVAPRIA